MEERAEKIYPEWDRRIDPVCGMDLTEFEETSGFCGKWCEERFKKEPEKFQGEPLIKLRGVWKIFKMGQTEIKVLRGFSLHIWQGDFVVIIGASGSGKTTALNMIGLLDKPSFGKVFLRGENVALLNDEKRAQLRSKTFGFVFQQYNLIPWLTAFENTFLPLVFAGQSINEDRLRERFQVVGLEKRMNHRPFELSGGEQQRAALLRALANDPEIILADEPTGNLDSATGNKILELLINLQQKQKKTLIIVTHDADIAARATQIISLKDGKTVRNHQTHMKKYTE